MVSNAYLLCRIADTIEDDKDLPLARKREFSTRFIRVLQQQEAAEVFAAELHALLSSGASHDERDLIRNTAAVIRVTHSFNRRQLAALQRCVSTMMEGMTRYQAADVRHGLVDQEDMDRYCYFVAGVVGEMLTELFCDFSDEIDQHHDRLMKLSVSFGQGLQMTNILKDVWDDRDRNMCWLPREVFQRYGSSLDSEHPGTAGPGFQQALGHLIGVALAHLANALEYTLLIPKHEQGIRRFCLWALGMAVLTLRKINRHRDYASGREVKISRTSVKATILLSNLLTRHDLLLRGLFRLLAYPLPRRELSVNFSRVTREA